MSRERALSLAQDMREVLLDHGAPEVSIELQPGRTGGWTGCDPVSAMSHHIASHPSPANPTPGLALVKRGRPDLGGPLANGTAGVDLVYRILCLDWANHPGYGGPWTVSGPCGTFTMPKDNARVYAWGTEYEGGYSEAVWDKTYTNRRTGKRMTFREFMGRCNAGLVEAIWLPGISSRGRGDVAANAPIGALAGYHGEHKTWAPGRKPDRLGYTTESGRAELRRYDTRQEDPMTQYADQLDEIERASKRAERLAEQTLKEQRAERKARGRRLEQLVVGSRKQAAALRDLAGADQVAAIAAELDRLNEGVAAIVDELDEISNQDAVPTP